MSKSIPPSSGAFLRAAGLGAAQSGQADDRLPRDGKQPGNKNTQTHTRDNGKSSAQTKDGDTGLNQRSALFAQKLEVAERDQGAQSQNQEQREDDDEQDVLLWEIAPSLRTEMAGASLKAAIALQPETDTRVEKIFKQVSIRLDAAIRPGPQVATTPQTISIPLDQATTGLTHIDVVMSDDLVTVKLVGMINAPQTAGSAGPVLSTGVTGPDPNQQLLAAAAQLGQMLQAHLPGRRIRIVQSLKAEEDDRSEAGTVASTRTQTPFSLFGPTSEDGRS